MRTIFRGAQILTCDANNTVLQGDVAVEAGLIVAVGPDLSGEQIVDVRGRYLMPGFVQTHVHLVQTLFRGLADDLALLDWLRTRIWPLERAHDLDSTYASARLGLTELLKGGTTAILDMATVHHTDAVFTAAAECGVRLWCGKAQMDRDNEAGLSEPLEQSMASACQLADRWHGRGRLRYAFAPRFVPSCSDALLLQVVAEARARGCLIHTHASENRDEVELVRQLTGTDNVLHLARLGMVGPDVGLAHCIHLTDDEVRVLAQTQTRLLHCPSSNHKLASGRARIPELLAAGVQVSVGADGAPCNNRLDMFAELRLAALMQKPVHGAAAMAAPDVLRLGTAAGAAALGFPGGQIAAGQVADLVVLDPDMYDGGDPRAAVVYALDSRAVEQVWIGGEPVVSDGRVLAWDHAETLRLGRQARARVVARAGLA